jgi:hypothetical protein
MNEHKKTEVGTLNVIAITLRYEFALSHNAFILDGIVIAFSSYRSAYIGPVIASYSYRSDVIHQRYCVYSLLLLEKIAFKRRNKIVLFCFQREKYNRNLQGKFLPTCGNKYF